MKGASRFIVVFAFFWTALVLLFDVFTISGLVNQWRSRTFLPVGARILSSEVKTSSGSDDTTHLAQVRYEFQVDGRRYEADRVRFGEMSNSDQSRARSVVRAHPAGSIRNAYYNPANPAEAVLYRGISRESAFLVLFLTPFNAAMLFLVGLSWNSFRPSPPMGGAVLRAVAGNLHVWHRRRGPFVTAVGTIGGVAFVAIFVLALAYKFSPPLYLTAGVLAGTFALGVFNAFWVARFAPATADLSIDVGRGTLTLPHAAFNDLGEWRAWKRAGRPPVVIRLEHIGGVEVRERVSSTSDGGSRSYVPVLLLNRTEPGKPAEYDLGSWVLQERAESFARWLRETLVLPPPA
ncbi:MAG TPA: DUF3592 domain-containing protein [Opitutaceae bacterium]|nr:DUF3592 domain-containing protein [Opitutaceae bacterium]